MKPKIFHINFGTFDSLAQEARRAVETQEKQTPSAMFENLNEFMTFMFPVKFMLLIMIKARSPASLYELAQLVGRSQSGILNECKGLEAMGFIKLSQEGPRKALKPSLTFPYDALLVHTEAGDCTHSLPSAA